jgi:hypothetical protein
MIRLNKKQINLNYEICDCRNKWKTILIETGKYYDFNRIPTELGKQITLIEFYC